MIKIVLVGPESSGKTTLAKQLAQKFNVDFCKEFSREYAENKLLKGEQLTVKDVLPIVKGQLKLEQKYLTLNQEFFIFDTNLLSTKVYAKYIYNFDDEVFDKYLQNNQFDIYFLCKPDFCWEFDPIRDEKSNRIEVFQLFKKELINRELNYIVLSGNKEKRYKKAIEVIHDALQSKK